MNNDPTKSVIIGFPLLAEAQRMFARAQFEKAAQATMAHLRRHPNEPRGLELLGLIAMQLGALGQAETFFRAAMSAGSQTREVRRNLASILNQQERLTEASNMFAALLEESDDPALRAILAVILDKLGRTDEAMAMRHQLVKQEPDNPHFHIAYGHSLRAAGHVDNAITAYRAATKIDIECGEAWWGLASIKKRVFTEQDETDIRKAIALAVDVRNSAPAHFALARALHDRGIFDEAFEHYVIGNRQRAETIRYDASELTAEVTEVERTISPEYLARLNRQVTSPDIPIFVVSLPRSGSTLLEQMLGSHADIEPVGELPYIPAILRSAIELATRRGKPTVPQLIASLSDAQADAMGHDYLQRAKLHRKTNQPYFVDKLPHNWSNIFFIKRILPQARFIDIRRPAMDCCFSNFTQSFSSAHASAFALDDIAQCYTDYMRLMRHLDKVGAGTVHHMSYTQLVSDPEAELRSALDYLDLPWDPQMLQFNKLERVVRTPSSEQVRRPLNQDGVDIWKPYGEWLSPLRAALGPLASS
jgi:tetratricopeptide (TPR) repeat protein